MKATCSKCKVKLNSEKGSIICMVPVYHNGTFEIFYLCRSDFLKSDPMNHREFLKWMGARHEKKQDQET